MYLNMPKKKTASKSQPAKASEIREIVAEEVKRQATRVETGVTVAVPNTIERKMEAIQFTAKALMHIAEAINGINLQVKISDCKLENIQGTGIHIQGAKDSLVTNVSVKGAKST